MLKPRSSSYALLILLILLPLPAQAGYLTIEGKPEITLSREEAIVYLSGTYRITNRGDEEAREVYPTFRLGGWAWAGDPRSLAPEGSEVWNLNESFPAEKLACSNDPRCAGRDLPLPGLHPLLVKTYYRDLNGYRFSAPSAFPVEIGPLNPEQQASVRMPSIQTSLTLSRSNKRYRGSLQLQSSSTEPRSGAISFFGPDELRILTQPMGFDLPAGKLQGFDLELESFSALPGSNYPVYAIVQWGQDGVRNCLPLFSMASVVKEEEADYDTPLIAGVAVLVVLFLYLCFRVAVTKRGNRAA